MADVEGALPIAARCQLREDLRTTSDSFTAKLPKVELHVHIEGCITPELKWKFSQRNKKQLIHPRTGEIFKSLDELQDSHNPQKPSKGDRQNNTEETLSFFEAYFGGFEVLGTKQDYYDLAMHYFSHAASMNVRYCEIFFDPQGHTQTGTSWETMMGGFREAQRTAETELNIKSSWIMCFLRDWSTESAMEHYIAALPYRDMIIGIGLDSNETDRPANMFKEVFARAKNDGFRITCHCDVGKPYPVEHIRQVVEDIDADRIDHGLNVVQSPELMNLIGEKSLGMTICPWSYIRHQPMDEVFERIRRLFEKGIRISIGSDDPAFMEDTWVEENLRVAKQYCRFTDKDILKLVKDAWEMSWAPQTVKKGMLDELDKLEQEIG